MLFCFFSFVRPPRRFEPKKKKKHSPQRCAETRRTTEQQPLRFLCVSAFSAVNAFLFFFLCEAAATVRTKEEKEALTAEVRGDAEDYGAATSPIPLRLC